MLSVFVNTPMTFFFSSPPPANNKEAVQIAFAANEILMNSASQRWQNFDALLESHFYKHVKFCVSVLLVSLLWEIFFLGGGIRLTPATWRSAGHRQGALALCFLRKKRKAFYQSLLDMVIFPQFSHHLIRQHNTFNGITSSLTVRNVELSSRLDAFFVVTVISMFYWKDKRHLKRV